MIIFLQALWFLFPAALANMAPVLVKKYFRVLKYPLDFNLNFFDGERILGSHKTFRGLFFAIIFSIIGVFMQKLVFRFGFFNSLSIIDYSSVNVLFLGFLIGFGVMFGDAVGSFFKRRFKIKPGEIFFPVDQADSPIVMFLILWPFGYFDFKFALIGVIAWGIGHLIINYIGWLIKLKKNKF